MKKLSIIICLLMLALLGIAEGRDTVILLGDTAGVPFDEIKAIYIANTTRALLQSCTVATKVDSIPAVAYKGVRITQADGKVIEAHIFPDSASTYIVRIYTKEKGVIKTHGKYTDHAYQLIGMLEQDRRQATTPTGFGGTNPVCWRENRIYHPGGEDADELKRMARDILKLARVAGTLPKDSTISPNKAYAFHQSDVPVEGPSGSTKVTLLAFTEKPQLLRMEASGVFSVHDTKWLNEKLIYFRVWFGRLGGVDVILDVIQDRFVLMEAMRDGRLLWEQAKGACKAAPDRFPECKEVCR